MFKELYILLYKKKGEPEHTDKLVALCNYKLV
jgi:hypothetical protein